MLAGLQIDVMAKQSIVMIEKEQHVYRTVKLWNCHLINLLMYINVNNTVYSSLIKLFSVTVIFSGFSWTLKLNTVIEQSTWIFNQGIQDFMTQS